MHARALEDAEAQLVELHNDEVERVGLSAVALGASLAFTVVYPPLVIPLFAGGLAMAIRGMAAVWRHWDFLDRLADDRDACTIPAVRQYASRDARMGRRLSYAARIRARHPAATPFEVKAILAATATSVSG